MESLKLKRVSRRLRRKENKSINSKFNFGVSKEGNIITSTFNPKAHTFNRIMREAEAERNYNFEKMLESFEKGEVSDKNTVKVSKGCKRNLYKLSVKKANDTRAFIDLLCMHIAECAYDKGDSYGLRPILICLSK